MRIIGGAWRGRALQAPPGETTRPTADRLRQAIFDRLAHAPWAAGALRDGIVLDVFAGTGAMGLEALSRGAASAIFVEQDRAALATLRANITACRATARCHVLDADARRPPRNAGAPCTLVFMDPPYAAGLPGPALEALRAAGWLAPGAILVLERERGAEAPPLGEMLAGFDAGPASVTAYRITP